MTGLPKGKGREAAEQPLFLLPGELTIWYSIITFQAAISFQAALIRAGPCALRLYPEIYRRTFP